MAEPRYGGAYQSKVSQEEIDAVYEAAAMKPSHSHPAPGNQVPKVAELWSAARKEAEEAEEPLYGGAALAKNVGAVDMRPIIDKKCHVNCVHAWEEYEKCEKRVEAKASSTPSADLGTRARP